MDNIKGLLKKVKLPEGHGTANEKAPNLKTVNKSLEEKRNEKAKVFGYIGMEVYERLTKERKLEITSIKVYIDKMDQINREIQELEKLKEQLEEKNAGKNICVCGCKLKPQDRFCPNCGKTVPRTAIICTCGTELKKESKFCRVCGKSVEELQKMSSAETQKPMKKCICGAMVPGGQFMCFECGRKVE